MNWVRMPTAYGIAHTDWGGSSARPTASVSRFLQVQEQPSISSVAFYDFFSQRGNTSRQPMDPLSNPPGLFAEKHDLGPEEEPQAELCAVGKRCLTIQELGSVIALSDWLRERLTSGSEQISQWGKLPGTKRVANLWLELSQGEISLEDSIPPKRTVHVASVKITNGSGKILLEAHQEMADGTIRERNRPLSEKMKPGENVVDACLRGIREELGADFGSAECVKMMQHTYRREVQERESFSYPGLMTYYVLHHMEAVMKHLPAEDFITEENELCADVGTAHTSSSIPGHDGRMADGEDFGTSKEDASAVGVKRHFWKWVPETSEPLDNTSLTFHKSLMVAEQQDHPQSPPQGDREDQARKHARDDKAARIAHSGERA